MLNVRDFNAFGDGTSDDTDAIQAALAVLGSTEGNTLYFPPGTYVVSGPLVIPENCVITGSGMRNTVIHQTGAHFAFNLGSCSFLRDMQLKGSEEALGGIQIGGDDAEEEVIGLGAVTNVEITLFNKLGAVGVQLNNCYRIKLDYLYIHENYIGIFVGSKTSSTLSAITTCEINKCNISVSTTYGLVTANDANYTSCELYFNACYFESNGGATDDNGGSPTVGVTSIYLNAHGSVDFYGCGFEFNTMNGGANTSTIFAKNPMRLSLEACQYSGMPGTGQTVNPLSGTGCFLACGGDMPVLYLAHNNFTNNNAISGYQFYWVRLASHTFATFIGNRYEGAAFANDAAIMAAMDVSGGGYPTQLTQTNERFGSTLISKQNPDFSLPSIVEISSTANLYSKVFPPATFGKGHGVRLTAWGKKAGTAGNKSVNLVVAGNSITHSWGASAATTAETDWNASILLSRVETPSDTDHLAVSVVSHDGSSLNTQSDIKAGYATGAQALTVSLQGVAGGGDSVTLLGCVLERF